MIGEGRRSFLELIGTLPSRSIRGANSHGQGSSASRRGGGGLGRIDWDGGAVEREGHKKPASHLHDGDPLEPSLTIRKERCEFMLDRVGLTSQTMLL
jgi:hypothetical protein